MTRFLVLFCLSVGLNAQILSPIMFGVDPDVKTPVDTNSGGSCTGSSGAWTCTGTTTVSFTDASADFIRYTNDGSTTPTFTTGTLFTSGVSTASTTTYQAVGCKVQNRKCGPVLTSVYTIASISVVTSAVGQSNGFGGSIATSGRTSGGSWNSTTGNTEVCAVRTADTGSTITVANGASQSFTGRSLFSSGPAGAWQWFYKTSITGTSMEVVTATITPYSNFLAIICYEVANVSAVDAGLDAGGNTAGSTFTSPTFSTSTAAEIVFFGANVGATGRSFTAGAIGGVTASGLTCSGTSAGSCASGDSPVAGAEYEVFASAQTSITAAINVSGASIAGAYGAMGVH